MSLVFLIMDTRSRMMVIMPTPLFCIPAIPDTVSMVAVHWLVLVVTGVCGTNHFHPVLVSMPEKMFPYALIIQKYIKYSSRRVKLGELTVKDTRYYFFVATLGLKKREFVSKWSSQHRWIFWKKVVGTDSTLCGRQFVAELIHLYVQKPSSLPHLWTDHLHFDNRLMPGIHFDWFICTGFEFLYILFYAKDFDRSLSSPFPSQLAQ